MVVTNSFCLDDMVYLCAIMHSEYHTQSATLPGVSGSLCTSHAPSTCIYLTMIYDKAIDVICALVSSNPLYIHYILLNQENKFMLLKVHIMFCSSVYGAKWANCVTFLEYVVIHTNCTCSYARYWELGGLMLQ